MTTQRTTRSISPPGLSRASTPESNAPSTPVLPSAFLRSSKMASDKPQVGFASPATTSAYRIPHWDERSVMRAFASHESHCDQCHTAIVHRLTLCRTGTDFATDIGKYFYCSAGKPYSHVDKNTKGERVQVEVPAEYVAVKTLFEAITGGLQYASLRERRPEVHQSYSAPSRSATIHEPTERYEIKPSTSSSRRHRANTYTGYGASPEPERLPKYETRSPNDEQYRDSDDKPRRESKRGSLYVSPERRTKRRSYLVPVSGWRR